MDPESAKTAPAIPMTATDVPATASDLVAEAGQHDRDDRGARNKRAEHESDLDPRESEVSKSDADEDAAEPVDESPQRLYEKDASSV
jgi:hypothetical protein